MLKHSPSSNSSTVPSSATSSPSSMAHRGAMVMPLNMHAISSSVEDEYMRSPSASAIPMSARVATPKKNVISLSPACNFEAFSHHFHLPLKAAAEKFGVRATAFKKRCRAIGIRHWPYRKVRSLKRSLQELNRCKEQGQLNEKQQYQYTTFKKQLDKLMSPETYGIDPSGRITQHHFEEDYSDESDDDSYDSQSPRVGGVTFTDCSISPVDSDKTFGDFSTPTHLRSFRRQQMSYLPSAHLNKPIHSQFNATELPSVSIRLGSKEALNAYCNKYQFGAYDHYLHEAEKQAALMRPPLHTDSGCDNQIADHPPSGCSLMGSHHDFMPTTEDVRTFNEAEEEFSDHPTTLDYSSERFFDDVFLQISPDYGCLV